jgi:hypothetical protein
MDVFFHGVSGALLASALGERRRPMLAAAALLGMAPDLIWVSGLPFGWHLRSVGHSFISAGLVFAFTAVINWRIAFAYPLHILVDLPLHSRSAQQFHIKGIDWWHGYGLMVAAALWLVLIALISLHVRSLKRTQTAEVHADRLTG